MDQMARYNNLSRRRFLQASAAMGGVVAFGGLAAACTTGGGGGSSSCSAVAQMRAGWQDGMAVLTCWPEAERIPS